MAKKFNPRTDIDRLVKEWENTLPKYMPRTAKESISALMKLCYHKGYRGGVRVLQEWGNVTKLEVFKMMSQQPFSPEELEKIIKDCGAKTK